MLPTTVQVPDALWLDHALPEGAKALWSYLRLVKRRRFTFKELRTAVGVCQNSLLKYLRRLAEAEWLNWSKTGLRSIDCQVLTRQGRTIAIPSDLILEPKLPAPAKWVWGLIARQKSAFHYKELIKQTDYCHETIAKYIKALSEAKWLEGLVQRVMRRAQFIMQALNPVAIQRQTSIQTLQRGMELARLRKGYSLGQYLLARMVETSAAPGTMIFENAEPVGLTNPVTGGQMHYDIFLPDYRVAIEFHGPQHDYLTELHTSVEEFEEQRRRDRLKEEISREKGITVLEFRAQNLTFDQIREALTDKVPLRESWEGVEHIYEVLERAAAGYRQKAARVA